MTKFFYVSAALFVILLNGSAFAGGQSNPSTGSTKAEDSAIFRVKVASCKAQARADGVKTSTADFYAYMSSCLPRASVTVAWTVVNEEKK